MINTVARCQFSLRFCQHNIIMPAKRKTKEEKKVEKERKREEKQRLKEEKRKKKEAVILKLDPHPPPCLLTRSSVMLARWFQSCPPPPPPPLPTCNNLSWVLDKTPRPHLAPWL